MNFHLHVLCCAGTGSNAYLGTYPFPPVGSSSVFGGYMDDLLFYNRMLIASEVSLLYNTY